MPERARRIMSLVLAALAVFAIGRVLIAYATRPSRWTTRFVSSEEAGSEETSALLSAQRIGVHSALNEIASADDLVALATRRSAMVTAIRNLDVAEYVDHFSSDAVTFTMAGIAIVGSAALAEAMNRTLRDTRVVDAAIATSDRRMFAGSIFEEGTFHIQLRTGEADVLSKGRFATLWKRELGEWRIVFEAVRAIG
jgi:ketosteroid isomerase-like protein